MCAITIKNKTRGKSLIHVLAIYINILQKVWFTSCHHIMCVALMLKTFLIFELTIPYIFAL